jgi:hypothetical protein
MVWGCNEDIACLHRVDAADDVNWSDRQVEEDVGVAARDDRIGSADDGAMHDHRVARRDDHVARLDRAGIALDANALTGGDARQHAVAGEAGDERAIGLFPERGDRLQLAGRERLHR